MTQLYQKPELQTDWYLVCIIVCRLFVCTLVGSALANCRIPSIFYEHFEFKDFLWSGTTRRLFKWPKSWFPGLVMLSLGMWCWWYLFKVSETICYLIGVEMYLFRQILKKVPFISLHIYWQNIFLYIFVLVRSEVEVEVEGKCYNYQHQCSDKYSKIKLSNGIKVA